MLKYLWCACVHVDRGSAWQSNFYKMYNLITKKISFSVLVQVALAALVRYHTIQNFGGFGKLLSICQNILS